jgi:hypothetical protein
MRLIKISDAQELGGALLDAEARIGILLKENPPTSLRDEFGRLSRKATLPEGISWNLSSQCQQLAEHLALIEQVNVVRDLRLWCSYTTGTKVPMDWRCRE